MPNKRTLAAMVAIIFFLGLFTSLQVPQPQPRPVSIFANGKMLTPTLEANGTIAAVRSLFSRRSRRGVLGSGNAVRHAGFRAI